MPVKKLRLDKDTDAQAIGWALATTARSYKIAWTLNKLVQVELERVKDIEVVHAQKKNISHFVCYSWQEEENRFQLFLTENQCGNHFMLSKLKPFALFLIITGTAEPGLAEQLSEAMRAADEVQVLRELKTTELEKLLPFFAEYELP